MAAFATQVKQVIPADLLNKHPEITSLLTSQSAVPMVRKPVAKDGARPFTN